MRYSGLPILCMTIAAILSACDAPVPTQGAVETNAPVPSKTALPPADRTATVRAIYATRTVVAATHNVGETATVSAFTPTPSPTGTATVVPLAANDPLRTELQSRGYELQFSTSHAGPDGFTYTAYAFKDTQLTPELGGETTSEICRIAFYRFDGQSNELIANLGAPKYPESSRYGGYPVSCDLAHWDDDFWFTDIWGPNFPLYVIRQAMSLKGFWSDINGNGLPELGILEWYCPNACHGYEGAVHFYEIQSADKVEDITAGLPGVLLPWKIMHSTDPITLYVFDPALEYEPHIYIDTWWIYAWGGKEYVDVTSKYADEYKVDVDRTIARLKSNYGQPFDATPRNELDLLSVLFTLEKAGQQPQALQEFLDTSDLANWKGTSELHACWLQVVRALAQEDYARGKPFSLPPDEFQIEIGLPQAAKSLQSKYDMSACKT